MLGRLRTTALEQVKEWGQQGMASESPTQEHQRKSITQLDRWVAVDDAGKVSGYHLRRELPGWSHEKEKTPTHTSHCLGHSWFTKSPASVLISGVSGVSKQMKTVLNRTHIETSSTVCSWRAKNEALILGRNMEILLQGEEKEKTEIGKGYFSFFVYVT